MGSRCFLNIALHLHTLENFLEWSICTIKWRFPGWNEVNNLARAFLELEGLSVTTSQAANIKMLYDGQLDVDSVVH